MMEVGLLLEFLGYVFILLACFVAFHTFHIILYFQHLSILGTRYEQLLPCNIEHFFTILDHTCESCRA